MDLFFKHNLLKPIYIVNWYELAPYMMKTGATAHKSVLIWHSRLKQPAPLFLTLKLLIKNKECICITFPMVNMRVETIGTIMHLPRFPNTRHMKWIHLVDTGPKMSPKYAMGWQVQYTVQYISNIILEAVLFRPLVTNFTSNLLCLSTEIMDGFWCSRCLNDHIKISNMMRLFADGATTPLVVKIWTKQP